MKKVLLGFLALCMLAIGGCTQIDTGNVGVQSRFGKYSTEELKPDLYETITKSVDEYTTKEVVVQLADLKPKSLDNLTMEDVDIDVYYRVAGDKVADLFIKYQGDVGRTKDGVGTIGENRVTREARESVFVAISKMEATTMHTKRDELGESVRELLQAALDKSDPEAFVITTINVKSLVTDKGIEQAIRDRARVEQDIAATNKKKELATSEAARLKEEARGVAEANNIISSSMTPSMERIRLAEIQRDTALALAGKPGNTVLLQGNASPLLNLK